MIVHILHVFGESEIPNFIDSIIDQNIRWFQISVDDMFSHQLAEPTNDLSNNLKGFILPKLLPLQGFLQIPMLTILSHNVERILGGQNILEFNDVGVLEVLQEEDLVEDGILEVVIVGIAGDVYFLDSYFLLGVPVEPHKHFAVNPFAQAVSGVVGVVSNHFHHDVVHSLLPGFIITGGFGLVELVFESWGDS